LWSHQSIKAQLAGKEERIEEVEDGQVSRFLITMGSLLKAQCHIWAIHFNRFASFLGNSLYPGNQLLVKSPVHIEGAI